jgi:hypothetical protein
MKTTTSSPLRTLPILGASVLTVVLGGLGCDEKKPPLPTAPAASSLAPSSSSSSSAAAPSTKLVVQPTSFASLDLPAPKERIVARVEGGKGALDVVPSDLAKTRGEVMLDLTTLTTSTFKDGRDKEQTAHARTWLEVADGEKGKLPDDVKDKNRYAVYAIRAIERASATDLAKVPATKDEATGTDVRKVTLTTKGELAIHGKKVERDADVEVTFSYAAGAPAEKPNAVRIATVKPFTVVLADHDVKPRDAAGKLAKDFFHLIGTKVADTADVTLDVRAKAP